MKYLLLIPIVSFALRTAGQDNAPAFDVHHWEAPYHLPTPQGWTVERFPIPISFAPQIPYTGVEDIRFAPGWGNAASEEYWSYAFLWFIDGHVKVNAKIIETHLGSYYFGLISNNAPDIPDNALTPVLADFKKTKRDQGDAQTFIGTIHMTDYMQQKPLSLTCKAHVKRYNGEHPTYILFQLSPQPFSHDIWSTLDQLWNHFKDTK